MTEAGFVSNRTETFKDSEILNLYSGCSMTKIVADI